jgi:hypothetical protein
MHIEALIQMFCLNEPWALGRRDPAAESPETLKEASIEDYPYFAMKAGPNGQFRVVGNDLDEVVENLLLSHPTAEIVSCKPPEIEPPPQPLPNVPVQAA